MRCPIKLKQVFLMLNIYADSFISFKKKDATKLQKIFYLLCTHNKFFHLNNIIFIK